jgi:hypothetical protein
MYSDKTRGALECSCCTKAAAKSRLDTISLKAAGIYSRLHGPSLQEGHVIVTVQGTFWPPAVTLELRYRYMLRNMSA